MQTYF